MSGDNSKSVEADQQRWLDLEFSMQDALDKQIRAEHADDVRHNGSSDKPASIEEAAGRSWQEAENRRVRQNQNRQDFLQEQGERIGQLEQRKKIRAEFDVEKPMSSKRSR